MNNIIFFKDIKNGIRAELIDEKDILNRPYQYYIVELGYVNSDDNKKYDIWYDWIYYNYYAYEVK